MSLSALASTKVSRSYLISKILRALRSPPTTEIKCNQCINGDAQKFACKDFIKVNLLASRVSEAQRTLQSKVD